MARFKVQWDYRSNYAAFTKGSEVDVEDDLAALVNRDSPGVLVEIGGIEEMTKKELLAYADEHDLEVDASAKVDDLREQILAGGG